jgi:hypothetical protein
MADKMKGWLFRRVVVRRGEILVPAGLLVWAIMRSAYVWWQCKASSRWCSSFFYGENCGDNPIGCFNVEPDQMLAFFVPFLLFLAGRWTGSAAAFAIVFGYGKVTGMAMRQVLLGLP